MNLLLALLISTTAVAGTYTIRFWEDEPARPVKVPWASSTLMTDDVRITYVDGVFTTTWRVTL